MSEGGPADAKRPREEAPASEVTQISEGEPPAKKQKIDENSATNITKDSELIEKKEEDRGSDDEEDIIKSGWLYIDSSGNRQGPFGTRDMQAWYQTGFIIDSLSVRRVDQTNYTPLGTHPILKQPPKPPKEIPQPIMPAMPVHFNPHLAQAYQLDPSVGYEEFTGSAEYLGQGPAPSESQQAYAQRVMFTSLGGRFKAQDSNTYWQSKGLSTDKAGRQMSSFFDVEKYQEEMAQKAAEADKKKPVKLSKKQIDEFKAKKAAKKVKRILDI